MADKDSSQLELLKEKFKEFPVNSFPVKIKTPFEKKVYDWYWELHELMKMPEPLPKHCSWDLGMNCADTCKDRFCLAEGPGACTYDKRKKTT